ncbi:cyclic nucleotide-binding domain-containing protein [Amaricoccus sp.]|uniref:cyclic nucleotide-binding domain-containing protein n=1 Tax=Amaricoccus sp. TaxID=1872485 RepID=UPI002612B864|nr:cyclic nucleotide-binding domain-containing protein [Amaricoccus sp.]HRO11111.1 helix-turn-helix domain-containing protein [Amaricoccus sp.]
MRADDVAEFRHLPLFRTMGDQAFESLIRGAYLQTFPPAVDLIREGDVPDFFHVLIEGGVELYAQWHDRETTMSTLGPLATFILAATVVDKPYLMSARTLSRSRIALIPSEDVRRVVADDRSFADEIVAELASGYRDCVRREKNLKLRSSVERLANYLIRLHEAAEGDEFSLPHEKRLIASWLGMTPENLSRAFASLRAYGVQVDGAQVRIAEIEDLRWLAKPTPWIDDPKS